MGGNEDRVDGIVTAGEKHSEHTGVDSSNEDGFGDVGKGQTVDMFAGVMSRVAHGAMDIEHSVQTTMMSLNPFHRSERPVPNACTIQGVGGVPTYQRVEPTIRYREV